MVDINKYRKKMFNHDWTLDEMSGCTGKCFIEGDKIVKIYYNPRSKEDFVDLTSYQSPRISFPIEYVKKRKYYYGEVLPYFPYDNIINGIKYNTKIDKLLLDYQVITDEIRKYYFIKMNDVNWCNILYDHRRGFYLIDITNWKYDESGNYEHCISNNIGDFNDSLFYSLWKKSTNLNCDDFYIKKYLGINFYDAYIASIRGNLDFSHVIKIYQELMREYYNLEVKTVYDLKKSVKILKKS